MHHVLPEETLQYTSLLLTSNSDNQQARALAELATEHKKGHHKLKTGRLGKWMKEKKEKSDKHKTPRKEQPLSPYQSSLLSIDISFIVQKESCGLRGGRFYGSHFSPYLSYFTWRKKACKEQRVLPTTRHRRLTFSFSFQRFRKIADHHPKHREKEKGKEKEKDKEYPKDKKLLKKSSSSNPGKQSTQTIQPSGVDAAASQAAIEEITESSGPRLVGVRIPSLYHFAQYAAQEARPTPRCTSGTSKSSQTEILAKGVILYCR